MSRNIQSLTPEQVQEILTASKEVQNDPTRFAPLANHPLAFAKNVLGVKLWRKQKEIMTSVRDNWLTAVKSGHGTCKTHSAAATILWWVYCQQGIVFSTAPTREHVETALWKEIHKLHRNALVNLPGELNKLDLRLNETWFARGLTTDQAGAFQGKHDQKMLIVVDEAAGVDENIHLEIGTCATDPERNRILMLGNPTATSGTFYNAFSQDLGWNCLTMSCLEHPNYLLRRSVIPGAVTYEWVETKRKEWGVEHPFWYSRVLGEFPKINTRGVIPLLWLEWAMDPNQHARELVKAEAENFPRQGGLDVARYGENKCVLFIRRGDVVEHVEEWSHESLMSTAGRAVQAVRKWGLRTLVVDAAGIGAGVVDRLLEQGMPVLAYNGQHRAFTPSSFANRRSEMWWALRTRLERRRLFLPGRIPTLIRDLLAPRYEINSAGRVRVETKEALLERGVPSPDYADALTLCFATDEDPLVPSQPPIDPAIQDVPLEPLDSEGTFLGGLPYGY